MYLGHENGKSGREFISYTANAVKERVAAILGSSDFLSILTDGSQAQKKGSDKEMELICTERNDEFSVHLYL